ncbi:smr (Small MutS Related) domain-containing protein [Thalictrum thalictroides]|uniref:Smr (Small MutS Related) domain-containing protein n=1 Tax=Thalictrum thalictroides TaxID=46969 RepID=A0A7J6VSX3_THATH|nr:smr (Small MutS Related) domain-containing protein [Thalictrum thalictroides]
MSGGVHEQWTSKVTLSASPSHSKIPWAKKSKSPGWTAFDLKQRGRPGLEPEYDSDPYPPIHGTVVSMPPLNNSDTNRAPLLKSFSSAVQPCIAFPDSAGNGNCSRGQTIVGSSCSKSENQTENENKITPLEKLKELQPWADEGLIEDILGAVNNNFDEAFALLKSMVMSGCSEEVKTNDNVEPKSLFENSSTENKTIQGDKGAHLDDLTYIAELSSALYGCVLDKKTKMTCEDVHFRTKLFDSSTGVQPNYQHIIAAPVEPEWEEDDIYLSQRKDAIRAVRSASQHSRAASNAFMRGDRISAQELSLKAREEWMAAEKLNAKAAEEILSIRNNGNDIWKLDLHGLHASEAVCALQNHLWKIETQFPLNCSESPNIIVKHKGGLKELGISWQRPTVLQVVTGTGNHSRGQASLPMSVRSFLIEYGYRFDEPRPGVIDVRPKFRHKQTG